MFNSSQSNLSVLKNTMLIYVRNLPFNAQCNCRPMYRSRACLCVSYDSHDEQRWYELVLLSKGYAVLYLLLLRASCRFTKYHTTNKCTNCMSFILKHFFKTLFTAPICFDSITLIIIREHI